MGSLCSAKFENKSPSNERQAARSLAKMETQCLAPSTLLEVTVLASWSGLGTSLEIVMGTNEGLAILSPLSWKTLGWTTPSLMDIPV